MFSLKTLATVAATMAVLATAAPAPEPVAVAEAAPVVVPADSVDGPELHKRLGLNIQACEHPNWTGYCWQPWIGNSNCVNVPNSFDNQISSIRNLDRNSYKCYWFEHFNCQGRSYDNQQDAKLQDGDGFFDDRISSLQCWWKVNNSGDLAPF